MKPHPAVEALLVQLFESLPARDLLPHLPALEALAALSLDYPEPFAAYHWRALVGAPSDAAVDETPEEKGTT